MLFTKPENMKYTQLCMYIDEHVKDIEKTGAHPDVEELIWNYLWLLTKALAIKKRYFKNFEDYDGYAFYSASRVFLALKNNLKNQGKTIKGKHIKPIKSSLNYVKALLYPMKVEYQNRAFEEVISSEQGFDGYAYREKMKDEIQSSTTLTHEFFSYAVEAFQNTPKMIDDLLKQSPFHEGTIDYKRVKMSLLLNIINNLNTKQNQALDGKFQTVLVWKMSKSIGSYLKVLFKEFSNKLKQEINDCYAYTKLDDSVVEAIISNPLGEVRYNEDDNK